MKSAKYDPEGANEKPFVYLIPEGSGIYKCWGRHCAAFGTSIRQACER